MSSRIPKDMEEGLVHDTKYGKLKVIKYSSAIDIVAMFISTGTYVKTRADHIRKDKVKDVNYPSVLGIGFLGEGDYCSTSPAYVCWTSMLNRCYNPKYHKERPNYIGCSVHTDWLNFQNFAEWYYANYKQGYQLDKDILVLNNKIYSADYCMFVPQELNSLEASIRKYAK